MRELNRIVVGYDASDQGRDALILAELLARTVDAELVAVRVGTGSSDEERDRAEPELDADLATALAGSAVRRRARAISEGPAAKALRELAVADAAVGLIALGSTHRAGLGRVVPGGVAERLLGGAPCSIAVAPRGFAPRSKAGTFAEHLVVIAVGYDASRESEAALRLATKLAIAAEATLRVIAVDQPFPAGLAASQAPSGFGAAATGDLQGRLHEVVAALPAELRALPIYERGAPGDRLLARAEEGVGLLVMGSRGHGPLGSALLGATSKAVLGNAPCPVIVVPRPALESGPRVE